jgi:hypothetical protein
MQGCIFFIYELFVSENFLEGNMVLIWNFGIREKQASLKEEETLSLIIGGGEDI